jgi:hypothetical protein
MTGKKHDENECQVHRLRIHPFLVPQRQISTHKLRGVSCTLARASLVSKHPCCVVPAWRHMQGMLGDVRQEATNTKHSTTPPDSPARPVRRGGGTIADSLSAASSDGGSINSLADPSKPPARAGRRAGAWRCGGVWRGGWSESCVCVCVCVCAFVCVCVCVCVCACVCACV